MCLEPPVGETSGAGLRQANLFVDSFFSFKLPLVLATSPHFMQGSARFALVVALVAASGCTMVEGTADAGPWTKCASLTFDETVDRWFDGEPAYTIHGTARNVEYRVLSEEPLIIETRAPAIEVTPAKPGVAEQRRNRLLTRRRKGLSNIRCWPPTPKDRKRSISSPAATAPSLLNTSITDFAYWCQNIDGFVTGSGSQVGCRANVAEFKDIATARVREGKVERLWLYNFAREELPEDVPGIVFEWFGDELSMHLCDPENPRDMKQDNCANTSPKSIVSPPNPP